MHAAVTGDRHGRPVTADPRIIILGVGNLLLTDEGVGPTFVQRFRRRWNLPANVEVVDGATAGLELINVFGAADFLIVVDTVRGGGEPGAIYRFHPDEVPPGVRYVTSAHQLGFMDAWTMVRMLGPAPDVVVIGVEPEDMTTPNIGLTPTLEARLAVIEELVLEALAGRGVRPVRSS